MNDPLMYTMRTITKDGKVFWYQKCFAPLEVAEVILYDEGFNLICKFDSVEELEYFLKGVK